MREWLGGRAATAAKRAVLGQSYQPASSRTYDEVQLAGLPAALGGCQPALHRPGQAAGVAAPQQRVAGTGIDQNLVIHLQT